MLFVTGEAGWVYCGPLRPCHLPWRIQPFLQIVVGGPGTHAAAEWLESGTVREHALKPGDVWLMPAGTRHQIRWQEAARVLVCVFQTAWVDGITAGDELMSGVYPLQALVNRELALGFLYDDLFDEHPKRPYHRLAAATALAAYLLRAVGTPEIQSPTQADLRWTEARQRLDAFLVSHLSDPFSLDRAARAVGMSRWHLSATFRARTTMTVRYYFNRLRVLRAKELLQTGYTVSDVMETLGFVDPWKFRQTFRQHLKCDPAHFRPQNRQR